MPIVAASNGVKPYIRALGVIDINKPVSPETINAYVGTGDYAAKYVSKLRKDGFVFTVQKDGRNIISYTLISEPECVVAYRAMKPKSATTAIKSTKTVTKTKTVGVKNKTAKAVKKTAKAVKKTKTPEEIAAKNLETMRKVSAKLAKRKKRQNKVLDYVEKELGSSGEIASSFAIDNSWDSMEGIKVRDLIVN
jgi:aspartyl/asparaginyl-tRNA synthetase